MNVANIAPLVLMRCIANNQMNTDIIECSRAATIPDRKGRGNNRRCWKLIIHVDCRDDFLNVPGSHVRQTQLATPPGSFGVAQGVRMQLADTATGQIRPRPGIPPEDIRYRQGYIESPGSPART